MEGTKTSDPVRVPDVDDPDFAARIREREAGIEEDSWLLFDMVRVLVRFLKRSREYGVEFGLFLKIYLQSVIDDRDTPGKVMGWTPPAARSAS